MGTFLLCLLLSIIIDRCSARYSSYGGYRSGSSISGLVAIIVVPIIVGIFIIVLIILCCVKKYQKRKLCVQPSQTPMTILGEYNQYAPPPYGQPPPYEQPPSYFTVNDPTTITST